MGSSFSVFSLRSVFEKNRGMKSAHDSWRVTLSRVLAGRLQEGAKALLASDLGREEDTARVVRLLYLRALSREPGEEETTLARPLLAMPKDRAAARQEGWEDVLWVLFMSPEFQFVR